MKQRAALIDAAKSHLEPGETVVDVTLGALHVPDKRRRGRTRARGMSLLVTDRRLIFFRKKWGGYELHSLHYDQIRSLSHSRGLKVGELRLTVVGQDVVRMSSVPSYDVERLAELIGERIRPS